MLKSTAFIIILAFSLSACASFAERRAQRDARNLAADKAECAALGFEVDTDGYRLCQMNLKTKRQSDDAARTSCIMNGGIPTGSGGCMESSTSKLKKKRAAEREKEELCQNMGKQLIGSYCK